MAGNWTQPQSMEPTQRKMIDEPDCEVDQLPPWPGQNQSTARVEESQIMVNEDFMRRSNQSLLLRRS